MADFRAQYDENEPAAARLRYLDFVQVAAIQAVMYFSSLYAFAKGNAGPLRSGVQAVEDTIKAVISPVYDNFHEIPLDLLKFVDLKLGEMVAEAERHVPLLLKKACAAAQQAPEVARSVAGEVEREGVAATAVVMARAVKERLGLVAKDVWGWFEPVLERNALVAWRSLNRLPVFPQLLQIVVPTAAYWTEKYNRAVGWAGERGYVVAEFLPLVPMERIAQVFDGEVVFRRRGRQR